MRILLVEDHQQTARTIRDELAAIYTVEIASTAAEALNLASVNNFDLILLDYCLPDMRGDNVCQVLRADKVDTPILMITGETKLQTKVNALDTGADDYLTKPFHFKELKARIRALLRRPLHTMDSNLLTIADLQIDLNRGKVTRGGKNITLRRKEFQLLEYLVRNRGNIVTRDMIMDHVWKSEQDTLTNTVDVHIKYLRDRIDRHFEPKLIKTIHGFGYKIEL